MLVRAPRNSLTRRCIHKSGAAEGREKKIAKDEREDRTIGLPIAFQATKRRRKKNDSYIAFRRIEREEGEERNI